MPRLVEATTPLPHDALLFLEMNGTEALSSLFDFRVMFVSEQLNIDPKALLGNDITLALETESDGPKRYFSGLCTRFETKGRNGNYHVFQAQLRPWLWLASRRSDSKIFQQQKVPDIIESVLGKYGFPITQKLSGSYRVWDYCVQYHETDLSFVSRLMEHEGIYYFFEHKAGNHTLVLCDGAASHEPLAPRSAIKYFGPDSAAQVNEEHIFAWRPRQEIDPGRYITSDYDYEHPKANLLTQQIRPAGHTFDAWERYAWPGGYTDLGDGEIYARTRMEALQSEQTRATGEANVRTMAPGYLINLSRCPLNNQNGEHLLVGVTYSLRNNEYQTVNLPGRATGKGKGNGKRKIAGNDSENEKDMQAAAAWQFTLLTQPAKQAYRAQPLTHKPKSLGPQVAVVVGPPGEEIYTDKYGRVKVQFPWDRYGEHNENSSCWMRVSHPWAGSNYGAIHIPRIGQEVIVDHIDGDPDYPIITGRVYNAEQMPPWTLPDNKTQSGILTRSSKDGTPGAGMKAATGDANAIRFEDLKGKEQLWFHAQKDQLTEVENDEDKWVGRDRRKTIDRDELNHIQRDRTETVDRNETITIHGQRDEEVDKNETIQIHQNRTETVDLNETVSIGINQNLSVGSNRKKSVGNSETITVAKLKTETIGLGNIKSMGLFQMKNIGMGYMRTVGAVMFSNVGFTRSDTVGMKWNATVGSDYKMTAGESITLECGESKLTMKKDGTIVLEGRDITIKASEKLREKAGDGVEIEGGPTVIVKAGVIDLN